MLRNLLDEIKHRHLWPIPLVALLVAIAAPLLFLKSTAQDASPASADAVTAPAGQLPARARRLLETSDVAKGAARRPARNANDPFQPPSHGAAPAAAAADASAAASAAGATTTTSAPAAPAAPADPVPVVITNSDGTPSATPGTPAAPGAPDKTSTPPAPAVARAVTIRFGEQYPAPVQHSVPRLQTFHSDDRVVAIFVKYSPARAKAVFAIAPSTVVTGNVVCRHQGGVCRYLDIAVGKHVRLATQAADGTLVSSRLDVVRIDQRPEPAATSAADSAPAHGSCLLAKLLTLTTEDKPLSRDAC